MGVATPTESASVGAIGAAIIAFTKGELTFQNIKEVSLNTVKLSSFVFVILDWCIYVFISISWI